MTEREFHRKIRVYYADTDAAGIVYHARYLEFMEKCRSDWLDSIDFDVRRVEEEFDTVFVLKEVNLEYHHPARVADDLDISCHILQLGKVRLTMGQTVYNQHQQLICTATVTLTTLDKKSYTLTPLPEPMKQQMLKWRQSQ